MNPLVARLMANKHTSGAGLCAAACFVVSEIGPIWFPEHAAQLKLTASKLQTAAVIYGLAMAGDASKADNGKDKDKDKDKDSTDPKTNTMKTLTLILLLLALTFHLKGAETNVTASPANWFETASGWLSSTDTNSTLFDAATFTLWAGNSYVNNANNASTLGADVRLWRSTNSGLQLMLESETLNAGVAGTLYSQQGGLQLAKGLHDLRLGVFLDGGYSFQVSAPFLEGGVDVRKALGRVTFMYTRVGYQFIRRQSAGVFEAGLGIVF